MYRFFCIVFVVVFVASPTFILKAQSLNFTTSTCPANNSISVTVTGGTAPYTYSFNGCGSSITQAGQPSVYTFTGITNHACYCNITVTDNIGASVTKPVFMANVFFPGVSSVYTMPCGPGNYTIIPIPGNTAVMSNLDFTLYAANGTTVIAGPQSGNLFTNIAGNAGDNFVVGIKKGCGGESFSTVTLANNSAINGGINCIIVLGITDIYIVSPYSDSISGASYFWTSPTGAHYYSSYAHPPDGNDPTQNGTWTLTVTIPGAGCTHTLSNSFSIQNCPSIIMPLQYSYIRANTGNNCSINFEWATEQEMNSDRFEVEISADGTTGWKTAAVVAAAGNSISRTVYSKTLNTGNYPVIFIRLKQVDSDGRFTYSSVIRKSLPCKPENVLTVSPTLIYKGGIIRLKYNSDMARNNVFISISDISGRIVMTKAVTVNKFSNNFDVTIPSSIGAGTYFVGLCSKTDYWRSNSVSFITE